jgi:hypothetical protein
MINVTTSLESMFAYSKIFQTVKIVTSRAVALNASVLRSHSHSHDSSFIMHSNVCVTFLYTLLVYVDTIENTKQVLSRLHIS